MRGAHLGALDVRNERRSHQPDVLTLGHVAAVTQPMPIVVRSLVYTLRAGQLLESGRAGAPPGFRRRERDVLRCSAEH